MLLEGKNTHKTPYLPSSKSSVALLLPHSEFDSAAPRPQSESLHCSSVYLHPSHTLVGSSLGRASSFYLVQFQIAKLCFAALRVCHRSSPSCITSSASSSSISSPEGPQDRHSGPSLYRSHLLPRLVELKQ